MGEVGEVRASVRRLKNSRVVIDYYRFKKETVLEMFEYAHYSEKNIELRMHLGLNEKGNPELHWVFADGDTGEVFGSGNESVPCPPYCCM